MSTVFVAANRPCSWRISASMNPTSSTLLPEAPPQHPPAFHAVNPAEPLVPSG